MEKKKDKIASAAFSRYRETFGDSLVLSLTFFLIFGSCMAVGILGIGFSLIAVLLIGLPALLSMQLMILRNDKEKGLSNRQSFMGFRLYYSFYFGVYRFWLSLFKALLVLILSSLVLSVALFYVYQASSSTFLAEVETITALFQQSDAPLSKLLETLNDSPSFLSYCSMVAVSSFFFAGYFFFHEIGKNTFNTYVRSFLGAAPSRMANAVFSDFFRGQRSGFYKDYYQANWVGIILFALGYAAGAAIGVICMGSISYALAFGFVGASLLLSPYLPYFFYAMDEIAKKREKDLFTYALSEAERAMEQNKGLDEFRQEDFENLQKYIEDLKKKIADEERKERDENGEN